MSSIDPTARTWWFDELAHAGSENLDPDHVARYDDKQDAAARDDVELLRRHGLERLSTVLDVGAGTGQFVLAVAPSCAEVTALDVSPAMIARLTANVEAAALDNVTIVRGGFLTYAHDGPPVDVVYSRWALHHLPDMWKALAVLRMRRHLRPGGLLRLSDVAFSCGPAELEPRVEQWRSTLPHHAPDGEWQRSDIDDHLRDEYSTFTWLLEPMIERAGFEIVERHTSDDGILADYVARAR